MNKDFLNVDENKIENDLTSVNTIINKLRSSIKDKKIASRVLLLCTLIVLIMTMLVGIDAYSRYLVGKEIINSVLAFFIASSMTILAGNMTLLCHKSLIYDKKVLDFAYENKNNLEQKLVKSRVNDLDYTYEKIPEIKDLVDYVDVVKEEDKKLVLTKEK